MRLLVVEDEEETRAAAAYFQALGYLVDTAAEAGEALRRARENPPDIVVTDIRLAGSRSGIHVARALRRERPDLPIIVLTGLSRAEAERRARGLRSDRLVILLKPLRLLELQTIVRRMVTERPAAGRLSEPGGDGARGTHSGRGKGRAGAGAG